MNNVAGLLYFTSGILAGILIGYLLLLRYGSVRARDIYIKKIIPFALILIIALFIAKIILAMFGIYLPF